jgi:hypothetical protein
VDFDPSAFEPAFAEIGHSARGLSWPEAAGLLWEVNVVDQTFADTSATACSVGQHS